MTPEEMMICTPAEHLGGGDPSMGHNPQCYRGWRERWGIGMTSEEIDAMPAGREMDALVAERILGLEFYEGEPNRIDTPEKLLSASVATPARPRLPLSMLRPYSTDDAAALEVLKTIASGHDVARVETAADGGERTWDCLLGRSECADMDMNAKVWSQGAPTLALALCRAALKASLQRG